MEVKDHLEVLNLQQLEQQQLLDALVPWINQKSEMLRERDNLLQKVFGKRKAELEKIRDEHHRLSLRARELKEKIDLIEYQKNVLKEKLVQIPSVKYKIDKLVDETPLDTMDEHSRDILKGIKQTNVFIRENIETRKKVVNALNTGRTVLKMTREMIENVQRSFEATPIDPIQGIMNNDFFPMQTYRRKAMQLVPEIGRAVRTWDEQIEDIKYQPKPKEKLSESLNEYYFRRIFSKDLIGYMSHDAMTRLDDALDKFHKHIKVLKKTLKSLEDEKQSFDQHKHELMSGQL